MDNRQPPTIDGFNSDIIKDSTNINKYNDSTHQICEKFDKEKIEEEKEKEKEIYSNNKSDSNEKEGDKEKSMDKKDRNSGVKFKEETISEKNAKEEDDTSSNNLFYLGNLFKNVVDKYDQQKEVDEEPRQLLRKTLTQKKISKTSQIKEEQSFNFNDIINVQLNEVKQNTLLYLDKAKMELDRRYTSYIKKINEYMDENEKKISKVNPKFETNENFINYADDKIFKQIDNLLEIHENIFAALEDHITLMFTFLEQTSLFQQKNPFEHFLNTNSNEILNCWFLSKINFDKLNLSNMIVNKNLSELVTGYLCKKRENNFAKITIQKDTKGNLSLESEFLRDNINNLKKLKFIGLQSDSINELFHNMNPNKNKDEKESFYSDSNDKIQIGKKLKSLSIIECNISKNSELPKINLPILRKVKIKKGRLPLGYFFDNIIGQTSFLKIINMHNCKITDKDFMDFFYYLNKKTYLQDSLEYLGFSSNDLTYINIKRFTQKGGSLKNLQYFDLSKNNIYEFVTDNFVALPMMNVLDLSDNNISNYSFFDYIYSLYKKNKMPCLILLSNNIFVSNNKYNNKEYRKYIFQCLTNFEYKIKKVNLSLLYNKDNNEDLITLRISPSVKISMIKLNLSYCGLNSETIWKFFQNNFGLLNLVSLNLSHNFISNNFFKLCAGPDILLEKLKVINLSMNQINCKEINDLKQIENYINNYQKLKRIKMQENLFMNDLFLLYEQKKNKINEIIDRLKIKEVKFDVDVINYYMVNEKLKEIISFNDNI